MEETTLLLHFSLAGIGATAVMDIWALILRLAFNVPSLDYALVGRWAGHMPSGVFVHQQIGAAAPVRNERAIGWFLHYLTGVIFVVAFGMIVGPDWLEAPTLPAALVFGALTLAFPFLVMQPAFGAGLAASKTPSPITARLRSLSAHLSFGVGLYLSAIVLALI